MKEVHEKVLSFINFTGEEYEDYNPEFEELKEILQKQKFLNKSRIRQNIL